MSRVVHVAVGVIVGKDGAILIAKRPDKTHQGGLWEFPGGKIETGETPQQALQREMQEEMGALVAVGELVGEVTHVYPEFEVTLHCFLCTVMEGPLQLLEHQPQECQLLELQFFEHQYTFQHF